MTTDGWLKFNFASCVIRQTRSFDALVNTQYNTSKYTRARKRKEKKKKPNRMHTSLFLSTSKPHHKNTPPPPTATAVRYLPPKKGPHNAARGIQHWRQRTRRTATAAAAAASARVGYKEARETVTPLWSKHATNERIRLSIHHQSIQSHTGSIGPQYAMLGRVVKRYYGCQTNRLSTPSVEAHSLAQVAPHLCCENMYL